MRKTDDGDPRSYSDNTELHTMLATENRNQTVDLQDVVDWNRGAALES